MESSRRHLKADEVGGVLVAREAEEARRKAEELAQELSLFHWAVTDPSEEASECAVTVEEKQELISTYVDAVFEEKLLSIMAIDYRNSDWDKLPEEIQNQCAVMYFDDRQ